jgi:hypothetical protein
MNVIIVPEFELPAVFMPAVGEGIHIAAKKRSCAASTGAERFD